MVPLDGKESTTGYTIITADSLNSTVASVTNHPHIGFGGQVHVYEAFDM